MIASADIRKICIGLSMLLHTGMDYFMRLPVGETLQIAREAAKIDGK